MKLPTGEGQSFALCRYRKHLDNGPGPWKYAVYLGREGDYYRLRDFTEFGLSDAYRLPLVFAKHAIEIEMRGIVDDEYAEIALVWELIAGLGPPRLKCDDQAWVNETVAREKDEKPIHVRYRLWYLDRDVERADLLTERSAKLLYELVASELVGHKNKERFAGLSPGRWMVNGVDLFGNKESEYMFHAELWESPSSVGWNGKYKTKDGEPVEVEYPVAAFHQILGKPRSIK